MASISSLARPPAAAASTVTVSRRHVTNLMDGRLEGPREAEIACGSI
mgnify:CR=1 FL=1